MAIWVVRKWRSWVGDGRGWCRFQRSRVSPYNDQLKLGTAFNIGVINESLLQNTYRQLLNQAQLLSLSEVSPSLFPFLFSHADHFAHLSPPPLFLWIICTRPMLPSPLLHRVTHHATRTCAHLTMRHAIFCTVSRVMHHAPRTTHHAPCTTHHAPHIMHHAPCTMHHVLCLLTSTLRIPHHLPFG